MFDGTIDGSNGFVEVIADGYVEVLGSCCMLCTFDMGFCDSGSTGDGRSDLRTLGEQMYVVH
jgi:hypothetical protein